MSYTEELKNLLYANRGAFIVGLMADVHEMRTISNDCSTPGIFETVEMCKKYVENTEALIEKIAILIDKSNDEIRSNMQKVSRGHGPSLGSGSKND